MPLQTDSVPSFTIMSERLEWTRTGTRKTVIVDVVKNDEGLNSKGKGPFVNLKWWALSLHASVASLGAKVASQQSPNLRAG